MTGRPSGSPPSQYSRIRPSSSTMLPSRPTSDSAEAPVMAGPAALGIVCAVRGTRSGRGRCGGARRHEALAERGLGHGREPELGVCLGVGLGVAVVVGAAGGNEAEV